MKKNFLGKVLLLTLTASVLTACGQNTEAENQVAENTTAAVEEESNVESPYLAASEQYESIISQLQPGQAYAFADMCSAYDVLLVTDYVYDNLDGNMATIEAKLYGVNPEGNVEEFMTVNSGGTAYPLAVYEGCLMVVNNASAMMEFIDPDTCSVVTKKCAEVVYDENGNATYGYMDYDTQTEGTVDDDSMMNEMYDLYSKATIINFTVVE